MLGFLYGQTEYNLLECSLKLETYVSKAKEFGYTFLTITDSNMYGHYKFYQLCLKNDIKPVIGLKIKADSTDSFDNYLLAYAINVEGYHNLLKMSSKQKIYNHIFSIDELVDLNGLIFISTEESDIYRACKEGFDELSRVYDRYKRLNDFGVGITLASNDSLEVCQMLRDRAYELGYRIFPLSQTLYETPEDSNAYEALMKIGSNQRIKKGRYHLKSQNELAEEFYLFEDTFASLEWLIEQIDVIIEPVKVSLPKYPKTDGKTSTQYLRALCEKGLTKRFTKAHFAPLEDYKARLSYELSVIGKMGYDDYFLIVWDFVLYAKKAGIMVGPGRGSAAGSLVAYCLGITNVDPIRYNLFFERFLNVWRVTMPDIDMDFPDDKRDEVISYVQELYGKDRVCNISAFGTFQVKSSLRDVGRVLEIDSKELDIIVKIAATTTDYNALLESYRQNEKIYELLSIAKKIENIPRHISTHAAGIILSEESLFDEIPLQNGLSGLYQSQLEATDLASLGLLKIDFLGLRNLNIINQIVSEIPGLDNVTIQDIPLDDPKTYNLLKNGDTLGIFQLESEGIKKVLRKLMPNSFLDIVAVLSLYRPGPMDNIDEFVARKNGKQFTYLDPLLEPILKETYGIIVYQEQIMQIANKYAGFSLGEADLLRRAVSKKDKATLDENRNLFVSKAVALGHKHEQANHIYDYIVKFANYGFNKSHSVAYALISYQMAYFKANYFSIFMSKILNNVIGNTGTIINYISYARLRGIKIYRPDINYSGMDFISKGNSLIYPLIGVNGIGTIAAKEIIKERISGPYNSFTDFKNRVKSINQKMLESLIFAGAFDSFGVSKKELLEQSDDQYQVFTNSIPKDELITHESDEYDFETLRAKEKAAIGFNITYDLFKNIEVMRAKYKTVSFSRQFLNRFVDVLIAITDKKELYTKNGEKMLVGQASDGKTEVSFVMFPEKYAKWNNASSYQDLLLARGRLVYDEKRTRHQFVIESLKKLE